jgi:hypothetical protein
MLELTEDQLRQLQQHEHAGFVARVRADVVREFPDADSEGLERRLLVAHDRALHLGLESPAARTQFLYQEAFAPGFYEQPAIAAWLTRPGEPPEQRWRDFVALAKARVEER